MRVVLGLEPRWRRGLQHRRSEVRLLPSVRRAGSASPGTSTLTTAEASSSESRPRDSEMGRSRHGAQLPVEQPSYRHRGFDSLPTHQRASRLTGRAPGSYPGTRLGSSPRARTCCRSSTGSSAGPSRRRLRVRVPSVARMSTWPNGEGAGLRNRRMQVRPLPSTPITRRSSAEQSAAFRRRRSHVRIVPARRKVRSEAIRPDEEPVPKTGRGREALVGASPTASSCMPRWSKVKTPGPQPGGRGSTPRRGTRCQVVERKDVRLLPGRRGFDPVPGSVMSANVPVVVVQRRGSRCAIPRMRVRVPPTTRNTPTHDDKEGVTCPPTSTTSSSPGRARSTRRPSGRRRRPLGFPSSRVTSPSCPMRTSASVRPSAR